MSFPLEPWQPRAVAKMVKLGYDEERAKRIAASVESQVRISAEDYRDLFKALDGEETADASG